MKIEKTTEPNKFWYDWAPIVEAAHANPDTYLKVTDREYPHSVVTALQRGKNSLFPTDQWEIRTEGTRYETATGKRLCTLVVKYTPKGNA